MIRRAALLLLAALSAQCLATTDTVVERAELKGSKIMIAKPVPWNGNALILAHGLRTENLPLTADFSMDDPFARTLLDEGWLIASTSYRRNGLIIDEAVEDIGLPRGPHRGQARQTVAGVCRRRLDGRRDRPPHRGESARRLGGGAVHRAGADRLAEVHAQAQSARRVPLQPERGDRAPRVHGQTCRRRGEARAVGCQARRPLQCERHGEAKRLPRGGGVLAERSPSSCPRMPPWTLQPACPWRSFATAAQRPKCWR